MKFYSLIDKDLLLFTINKFEEITEERKDLSFEQQSLQVSTKKIAKGKKFKAHKHLPLKRETDFTEEAWVFLSGAVKAIFYDIDDKICYETVLKSGDCAVVYRAGHSFEVLEDNTILYEFKS